MLLMDDWLNSKLVHNLWKIHKKVAQILEVIKIH